MSKFGIRAMSQSLAREFGPQGIHVSHAIIDGIIDTEKTKGFMEDIPDAKIDPDWVCSLDRSGLYCSFADFYRLRSLIGFCILSPGLLLLMS